ncbi:hypothetical protein KPL70_013981 [Citrus sinensis]|nr:hypothetical protein KPL70_013981 [Citrus sinensis]
MKMKAVLRKNNCLAAIGERPMEITDDKWNEVDGNAISDLHLALADGVLSSVAEKNTAKEIWDTLTKLYEAKSLHNKIFLKRKLYTLRMAESTMVTDHINTLKTLFSQLTTLGHNIEENERAELLLQNLPDSYDQLIINLTNNNPVESLVFDDVAASVLNEESRQKNKENRQASSQQAEALSVTRGRSTERGPSGSQSYGRSKSRSKKNVKCYNCGKKEHVKKECWSNQKRREGKEPKSSNAQGCVASTSDDGEILYSEATIISEGRKRLSDVWLIDSGATWHMTSRREWFHTYEPISEGSVYMGNDHALEITGIEQGLKILSERKLLLGLKSVSLPFCEHCVTSKQHRLKFSRSIARSKCILDLIHSDVWESPDISMGGAKYMVTFIDDYSRRCWVYLIKKKSYVFPMFKEYKARVELESGKKIKCLRTDNGGEYTDGEFLAFCKQEGIQRQFTVAYTPQQNRVAERMNRTLTERIRTMLRTAGLPNSFWAEAAKTACYIVNRSPSTAIGLKTGMKMWTGKPTDYSYLHAFGCPVYVMYNAQERTKLDPKSRRCIFLGYADGVNGYHGDDGTIKEKSEIVSVYVENNPEDSDSSEAAPEHEEQELVESEALEVRRSTRERRPPTWHSEYVTEINVAYCLLMEDGEPSTFHEALNNSDVALWMTVMQEEIEALHKNKTWELVPLPHGRKAIGNKWVYKIKRDGNDQVERYRARLVVKGYAQKEGIDFNEIFSPVVRLTTVRIVLAILSSDHCAYYKRFEDNDFIILLLYVDDMLVAGPNRDRIQELKAQLAREFEMKNLGPANKILGMQIHRDRNNRKIWLSQKNYLKKILRRFNMQDCKSISTPLPINFKLSSSMCPSNEAERNEMSRVPYASAVGSLMFTMICTRPDIAQAVGAVSRYMANPGGEHWITVKRILRYIRGTSDVALCYGGSEFIVRGYVDSDFAGDLDKRKSTTGYVFSLAGAAVSWVLKLLTVVALSTTEAEYMAATQACKEAIWIQRLLEELGHKQQKIPVFCDSQSALHIARNPAFHSRTKHIGVQYHFVREVVEDGSVDLQKIHTKENLADVLTKPINTNNDDVQTRYHQRLRVDSHSRTSVNDDGKLRFDSSDLGDSNGTGSDLPRAVMAADRAPKAVSSPAVVHGQNGGFRWRGWLENDEGELRNKIQVVAWLKICQDQRRQKWVEPQLFKLQTAAF